MQVLGWSVATGADGQRVCTPPAGRAAAWVEVRDRERTILPLRDLVAARCAALRAEGVDDVAISERATRLVTAEGELAAIATIAGIAGGAPTSHVVAAVYADELMVTIDGRAVHPDQRAAVRAVVGELVSSFPLGLGELRCRRYLYTPPAGWDGVATGLVTDWYPPDVPRTAASIKVLPARPLRQPTAISQLQSWLYDTSFASFVPEGKLVRDDADFGGFTCIVGRTIGRFTDGRRDDARRMLITAGLTDNRFVYTFRLDSGEANAAAHEQAFLEVVRSCVPLPSPAPPPTGAVFAHWIE